MRWDLMLAVGVALAVSGCATTSEHNSDLVTTDHQLRVRSAAPSMAGQETQIYVREVARRDMSFRGGAGVVLFVHGAGTPAEVAFDPPYRDYSWMAYLANAGFDVFSMDMTGYGRSTRPKPMTDPCNFPQKDQAQFVPSLIPAVCAASHAAPITTISSDWNDIGAVVDHLRALRGVDKVSLVAWSQGGPRTGGYVVRHPEKVARIVALAPGYNRKMPAGDPATIPTGTMTSQSQADFAANWNRQVGCAGQYEQAASDAIWADMLASDPVGAKWGKGVRRAPRVISWGFDQAAVAKITTPYLMVTGEHDKQVAPERVRQLYADIGSSEKVLVDLACSSHNAMWEKNRLLLYRASLEWLRDGKINGTSRGEVRLGY